MRAPFFETQCIDKQAGYANTECVWMCLVLYTLAKYNAITDLCLNHKRKKTVYSL